MKTHIMIDLETWGTTPGCDIRSIGACVFNPMTRHVPHGDGPGCFYVNTIHGAMYDLKRDAKTVSWWNDQSDAAQAAFTNPPPVSIKRALIDLNTWVEQQCGDMSELRLWAHGPHFDVSIIEAAYRACVIKPVWPYRAPRDTRTILDAAGIDPVSGLDMFTAPNQIAHHALHDALCQARAVCAAYATIERDY